MTDTDKFIFDQVVASIKEVFHEDWMTPEDWNAILTNFRMLVSHEESIEGLVESIKIGISNGYSLERQLELAKHFWQKIKNDSL